MTIITIAGLGEAGSLYATGLQDAGARIRGFDPFVSLPDRTVRQFDTIAEAGEGTQVVISLVGANASRDVALSFFPYLTEGTIFADFNTSSPSTKAALAEAAAEAGILFADVAVLAPVPRAGSKTPLLVSGTGAPGLAELLRPLGAPIEIIDGGSAGEAAARKLLRSVFMKGLAALVLESLAAGEAAGNGAWLHDQMVGELGPDGDALLTRLVSGSHAHAARRVREVSDSLHYLRELGTPHWMTEGTLRWLSSLRDDDH